MKLPVLSEDDFLTVRQLMENVSGIVLAPHKKQLVASRLMKRLRALGLDSYKDYVNRLKSDADGEERRLAIDLLTTNETFFYRESVHFEVLAEHIRTASRPRWRIWSAASSSGEEVYTLAMTLTEALPAQAEWEVIGSDLCRHALASAKAAVYPVERARLLPQSWLRRFTLRGVGEMDGYLQVVPELRQRVSFRCINLNENLPADLGQFDVIFLRNILIYFDGIGKRRLVERVLTRLRPGGLLFVGHSENLHGLDLPLENWRPAVLRKRP